MISELEAENRALQDEYDRLKGRSNSGPLYGSHGDGLGARTGHYSNLGGTYDLSNSMITSPSPGSECSDKRERVVPNSGNDRLLNGSAVPSEEGEYII
jgi:hypothetical protein